MKKKKIKKNIDNHKKRFFFEDYLRINKKLRKENFTISEDRVYILFFSFFFLILIFSLKIIFISFQNFTHNESKNYRFNFNPIRSDIVDRNGVLLSRNITAYHAAIKPNLIKDKKNF